MTSINTPRDDEGVVRRRLQRAGTALVGKARRSAPSAALRRIGGQTNAAAAPQGWQKSTPPGRGPERRMKERRIRRVVVLLDTRSPVGNRRRGTRRGQDRLSPRRLTYDAGNPPAGTVLGDDIYA